MPRKYAYYRPPRVVKTAKRWYVEYWYRIPIELREKKKEWKRFRVFEDINRYKTDEYANELCKFVAYFLDQGYDPFANEKILMNEPELKLEWSFNVALDQYLDRCRENGLRPKSLQSYGTIINFVKEYFLKDNSIYRPLKQVSKEQVKTFMNDMKIRQGWNNNTYNKNLGYLIAVFNWFVREEKIDKNPAKGLELKKVAVTKHKYFDDKTAALLKLKMELLNPYLLKFITFIYYTATRPKSEARLLKCKHVLFDRKLLFIPASISKNKKDDYIPMSEELISLLKGMGIDSSPSEYYIFSASGKPDSRPASQNYFASKFKPFKDSLKLGDDYSIYGFKHLRAIHLAQDGADPYEIMRLFRHSDLSITSLYLREIGIADTTNVISKTRKF